MKIMETGACADDIHMLVRIPPHISISQFMGFLKGKSLLMIFGRHTNLKYKYGSTVRRNKRKWQSIYIIS